MKSWPKIAVFCLLALLAGCQAPHEFAGLELPDPQVAADFTLESAAGPVHLSDFEDQYVLLFFGYTFCPDICPATLAQLGQVRERLGEDGEKLQVLMITVDPDRDTPERMAEYVGDFDPTFVGLTGDQSMIDEIGKSYGLFYEKLEGTAETGYLVNHTARTFLIDRLRQVRVAYSLDTPVDGITADLRHLIESER